MTIFTDTISPLYTVGDEVVFYKKDLYKTVNQLHQELLAGEKAGMDIFGNVLESQVAANYLLRMVDYPGELSYAERVALNCQIGNYLVALWREYVYRTGAHGQGVAQLQAFSTIGLGLMMGCLYEAAQMIPQMPEDDVVNLVIKGRFAAACVAADRLD